MLFEILKILIIAIILDIPYLLSHKNYFNNIFRKIQGSVVKLNLLGAIICYILISLLIYFIVIQKKLKWYETMLLGSCVYGIYESTNYATFKKWPIYLLIVDTLWGGILFLLIRNVYLYL